MLPKSPVGQALHYVLPRWDGLIRYCENGALSIDNNLSERMVGPAAIGRKNYSFMGSDSSKAAAVLYSIMASAKANQVEPFAYRARSNGPVVTQHAASGHNSAARRLVSELLEALSAGPMPRSSVLDV